MTLPRRGLEERRRIGEEEKRSNGSRGTVVSVLGRKGRRRAISGSVKCPLGIAV